MGSYQQFGTRLWAFGASGGDRRGSPVGRILFLAGFIGAVCLIAIVIGAATAQ